MTKVTVREGAIHLQGFLSLAAQKEIAATCLALGRNPAGFYLPTVKRGGRMHLQMMCLGRHWNPRTYTYQATREDYDGLPVQAIPAAVVDLSCEIAREAGMELVPDVAIVNYYSEPGDNLGLHQDQDESEETLKKGIPVVSISLGDDCRFLFGDLDKPTRLKPARKIALQSGDAFVFGGTARLCRPRRGSRVRGNGAEGSGFRREAQHHSAAVRDDAGLGGPSRL